MSFEFKIHQHNADDVLNKGCQIHLKSFCAFNVGCIDTFSTHPCFQRGCNSALISRPEYSSALHAPVDHRLVRWEWEENEKGSCKREEGDICTMEELKEGVREELLYSSEMFKADPLGLLFLCSHFPSPLSSLSCTLFLWNVHPCRS